MTEDGRKVTNRFGRGSLLKIPDPTTFVQTPEVRPDYSNGAIFDTCVDCILIELQDQPQNLLNLLQLLCQLHNERVQDCKIPKNQRPEDNSIWLWEENKLLVLSRILNMPPKRKSTKSKQSKGTTALVTINREAAKLKASNPRLEHRAAISMASKKYNRGLLK